MNDTTIIQAAIAYRDGQPLPSTLDMRQQDLALNWAAYLHCSYHLLTLYESEGRRGLQSYWEVLSQCVAQSALDPGPGECMTLSRAGEIAAALLARQCGHEADALCHEVKARDLAGDLSDDDPLIDFYGWYVNECQFRRDLRDLAETPTLAEDEALYSPFSAFPPLLQHVEA